MADVVKPVAWIGSTKKDLLAMPETVQKQVGFILFQVQCGKTPPEVKALKGFGGAHVQEIIVEDYPDDPRGASCLILGHAKGRAIHVVCGFTSMRTVRIITVYLQMLPKWLDERTRRDKGVPDA